MSKVNAEKFIEALEKDLVLRNLVNLQQSMVTVAWTWTKDPTITLQELEDAIKVKWGVDCLPGLSKACFSEVPGF